MNAKQRRAHTRELTALYKGAVPSEFNAELVSELIDAGKDIKHKENVIEALRAEIEALKQQVEQGKRDAVPDWQSIATVPNDTTKVLVFSPKFGVWETTGRYALQPKGDSGWIPIAWKLSAQSSDEVLAAIAAAPRQEK